MDNGYIYKEKDKELNDRFENQLIDGYLQENEQMQAGYDMEKKHINSVDQMLNLNKTEEDVANISRILDNMKLGKYEVDEQEVKQAKLEAIQGRMLSHLMLNDQKLVGDSDEMEKVKNTLSDLETAMTAEQVHALTDKNIDFLQQLYENAINACQNYCDKKNPWLPTGKRRKAKVKATLERLIRESDSLEIGRMIVNKDGSEAKEINSGLKLLSLTAVQNLADEMAEPKRKQKLEEEIDKIEDLKADIDIKKDAYQPIIDQKKAEYEMKKAEYDQKKAEYDALYKRKEEVEKIGFFKLKFGGDAELDGAYEKLKEYETERDNAEDAYEKAKEELDKFDEKKKTYDADILKLNNDEESTKKKIKEKNDADKASAAQIQEENVKQLENKISELPADLQVLARMISNGTMPTSIIKNKKKVKDSEKKALSDLLLVRKALNDFKVGTAHSKTIRIAGKHVRLLQDEYGNAQIQYGKVRVPIAFSAAYTTSMIATDVMHNRNIYGEGAVLDVLNDLKTNISEMTRSDVIRTRDFSTQILFEILGVPKTLLNNFPSSELKTYAISAYRKQHDKATIEKMKKQFLKVAQQKNDIQKTENINTLLNQELQNAGIKDTTGIELHLEEKEDKSNWDEREQKVRDLAADLIYSSDTWVADGLIKDPAERMKHVLLKNADAVALIVADQFRDKNKKPDGLIEEMVAKLPLMFETKEDEKNFKTELADNLKEIRDFVSKNLDGMGEGFLKNMAKSALATANLDLLVPKIKEVINDLGEEEMVELKKLDKELGERVDNAMSDVQNAFESCINVIFEDDEEEQEEKHENKQEEKQEEKHEEDADNNADDENDDYLNQNVDEVIKLEKKEEKEENKEENPVYINLDDGVQLIQDEDMDPQVLKVRKQQIEAAKKEAEERKAEERKQELKKLEEDKRKFDKNRIKKSRKRIKSFSQKAQDAESLIATRNKNIAELNMMITDKLSDEEKEVIQGQINQEKQRLDTDKAALLDLRVKIQKHKKFIDSTEKKYRIKDLQQKIDERLSKKKELEDNIKMYKAEYERLDNKGPLSMEEGQRRHELENYIMAEENQLEKLIKKSGDQLDNILKDNIKGGKKGQSLFMKNVFKIYFKSMEKIDKRSMVASAIKNSNAGPKLSFEQRKNLSDDQLLNLTSSMIGGMFKGAGPLFQKMLQGLPIDSLPKGLRKAVEDTQDSLASIPDEVVQAHMESIKVRSAGKITKIEVNKSLGAASVGQAFLCKVYGPEIPEEGKNVVIKLLRPDVRNRMMREKKVMLEAARMTDEDGMLPFEVEQKRLNKEVGGMEATYLGNLQRIEEELDLTIEANNCKEGQVYDNPVYDKDAKKYKDNISDSMKLSDLAEPTSDTCVMEIAGTKTVKRFMSDVDSKISELLWDYCEKEDELDKQGNKTGNKVLKRDKDGAFVFKDLGFEEKTKLVPVVEEVEKLLQQHEKTQKAIAQVVEKWVTEGIFQKGYYHGDLHAGNIMISEKGVTVIDFGNATILSSEQQKHIIKMMIAATMGDVERFRHGFHMLLENTPEEVYQEKREELTLAFKDVLTMGGEESAAERIAVALVRAQELGIELPPTIANFSSCQMRLQNTLGDVNKSLMRTRAQLKKIRENSGYSSSQRELDPIADYYEKTKNYSAQEKLATIDQIRKDRTEITENDFKNMLSDKSKRKQFMKKFGWNKTELNKKIEKDIKRIDDLFTGKTKPTEEEREKNEEEGVTGTDYFSDLFDVGQEMGDMKHQVFYNKICNDSFKLAYEGGPVAQTMASLYGGMPKSFEDFLEKAKKLDMSMGFFNVYLEVSDLEKKMIAYQEAQDNPNTSPEELKRLEQDAWDSYKREVLDKSDQKAKYIAKCEKLLPIIKNDGNDPEATLFWHKKNGISFVRRVVETSVNNKTNGEQLRKVSDEYIALHQKATESVESYNQTKDELNAKYKEFMDVLWEAQNNTLIELSKDVKDKVEISNEEPDNFLKIMGKVMEDKKYSVLWTLDLPVTIKMIYELTKENLGIK